MSKRRGCIIVTITQQEVTRELIDAHLRLAMAKLEAEPSIPPSLRSSVEGHLERVQELVKEALS